MGVGVGDIVAVQVPNWWEFVIASLACGRIGAVVNPLMPIFRERELEFMLGFAEAKVLIVPAMFRGFDHAAMAEGLRQRLPKLQHVLVVDGTGDNGFDRVLLVRSAQKPLPVRHSNLGDRLAAWMLSITRFMVPASEQPVRASKVAELVDVALRIAQIGRASCRERV